MRILKPLLVTLVLLLVLGTYAVAQTERAPAPKALSAAQLEKQALEPALEGAILRAAAAKLRQENRTAGTVEVPIVVSASSQCMGGIRICVGTGVNRACTQRCPETK